MSSKEGDSLTPKPKELTQSDQDFVVMDEEDLSKPTGLASIAVIGTAVCLCWFKDFPSDYERFQASLICCILATVYVFIFKMSVKPTSVFLMTAFCSLLNSIAFGSLFPYKYFVIFSACISLIQTLLLLPLKMPKAEDK